MRHVKGLHQVGLFAEWQARLPRPDGRQLQLVSASPEAAAQRRCATARRVREAAVPTKVAVESMAALERAEVVQTAQQQAAMTAAAAAVAAVAARLLSLTAQPQQCSASVPSSASARGDRRAMATPHAPAVAPSREASAWPLPMTPFDEPRFAEHPTPWAAL